MTGKEVRIYKGIYIIKVKGLSIHSAINHMCNQIGYIVFCQSSKNETYSYKEVKISYYRDKFLRLYICKIRKIKILNWEENDSICPEIIVIS